MPRAVLRFSLPEEEKEFRYAVNGLDYFCALESLASAFRDKAKYSEDKCIDWSDAKDLFWEVLNEANITLE